MGKQAPTIPRYSNSRKCGKIPGNLFPKLQILTEHGHGQETSAAPPLLFVHISLIHSLCEYRKNWPNFPSLIKQVKNTNTLDCYTPKKFYHIACSARKRISGSINLGQIQRWGKVSHDPWITQYYTWNGNPALFKRLGSGVASTFCISPAPNSAEPDFGSVTPP